jgi:hypothetical protein
LEDLAKMLVLFGVLLVIIGGVVFLVGKVPFVGRLPGDINIQQGNFSCFFPLATSILLSIALTVVLNLIIRIINK